MAAVWGAQRAAVAAAALCAALLLGSAAAENCGRRLEDRPEEFAACKDGSTICYFFKSEGNLARGTSRACHLLLCPVPSHLYADSRAALCLLCLVSIEPFIILPPEPRDKLDALEKPFECSRFAESGLNDLSFDKDDETMRLGGFGFGVLEVVAKKANVPTLCFLAGPDCTFNELVEYLDNAADPAHPASGMLLGITGLLLFTPRRVELGISSAAVFDDKMIIIQRIGVGNGDNVSSGVRGAWRAAMRPFATNAWTLCLSALSVLLLFVSIISLFRPTPFLHSEILMKRNKVARWISNFIRNTIGGSTDQDSAVERGFEPARMTLRLSLVTIIGMASYNSTSASRCLHAAMLY